VDDNIGKKIVIITSFAKSIVPFEGTLIEELVSRGLTVYVICPDYNSKIMEEIIKLGGVPINYYLDRTGVNPFKDILSICSLMKILKSIKPDIVLTENIKPNLYGSLVSYLLKIPKNYMMITGFGYVFIKDTNNIKKKLVRAIVKIMYKIAGRLSNKVFFLNEDDKTDFIRMKIISEGRSVLLGGRGVNLSEWLQSPPHLTPFTFTFIGRLLHEKGIIEYIKAAELIKEKYFDIKFIVIGPLDSNPSSIPESYIKSWVARGLIEWIPWTDDIKSYLKRTSVFVLPSYREGVPRSAQEALAMSRPIITTDVPGCRETVIDRKNGFLVPPENVSSLAMAMEYFLKEPELIEIMGIESRKLAEQRFNVFEKNRKIINEILS